MAIFLFAVFGVGALLAVGTVIHRLLPIKQPVDGHGAGQSGFIIIVSSGAVI